MEKKHWAVGLLGALGTGIYVRGKSRQRELEESLQGLLKSTVTSAL